MRKLLLSLALCAGTPACSMLGFGGGDELDTPDSVQQDLKKVDTILDLLGTELIASIARDDLVKAAELDLYLQKASQLIDVAIQGYAADGTLTLADATPALVVLRDAVVEYISTLEGRDAADKLVWTRRVNSAETLIRLLIN